MRKQHMCLSDKGYVKLDKIPQMFEPKQHTTATFPYFTLSNLPIFKYFDNFKNCDFLGKIGHFWVRYI